MEIEVEVEVQGSNRKELSLLDRQERIPVLHRGRMNLFLLNKMDMKILLAKIIEKN